MSNYKITPSSVFSKKIESEAFIALAKSGKSLKFLIADIDKLYVPMVYFEGVYEGVYYEEGCVVGSFNLPELETELHRVAAELKIPCSVELVSDDQQVTFH